MKLYMLKQLSVMYVSSVRNHQFTVQIILFLCYLLCISTSLWIFLMFRDLKIDQRSSELFSENEKANKTKHTTGTQTGMIETWHIAHYLFVSQFQGENTTYSSPWSSVGVYPTQFSESCSLKKLYLNNDLIQPSRCISSQLELAELQAIFCSCCANTYSISLSLILPLQNRNNSSSKRPYQTIIAIRLCV